MCLQNAKQLHFKANRRNVTKKENISILFVREIDCFVTLFSNSQDRENMVTT